MTFEQIKELIDIVTERKLQAVEIERAGFRLKIDGQAVAAPRPVETRPASAAQPAVGPDEVAEATLPPPPSAEGREEEPGDGLPEGVHLLNSPIVGTFYAAPSPDAEPYARVGDRVKKGQVLCIVEAMKLMNEIESDADGVLLEIFPKNAQPVEYGEPLFAIQPD
ncbi:MAG: acetyl-CoA carboxylase biotin carboxyl carrier protein [Thermoanaerobaculia bacterium]|nr:acetyl-CoA carboxylase biotin carboxyl carrier protein [Thermoanaerobaculia bacterium]